MSTALPDAADARDKRFFGHPEGLSTLFFTEMWERFSYYGMRALLILFMTAPVVGGGLGLNDATAGAVYGLYTAMVYAMALPGGWIADRILGLRRAVLYGGVLIAAGHFTMAVPGIASFYAGLVLIVLGTGLLKPNISAIVGQLYSSNDARRDAGFSIFYMGINIGSFTAPLVCGWLGQRVDWHLGFGAAGIGMTLGLVQYSLGGKKLGDAGLKTTAVTPQDRRSLIAGLCVTLGLLALAAGLATAGIVTIKDIADSAGIGLLVVTLAFFGWLFFGGDWTPVERKRLYVIGVLFVASTVFWSVFEQAGSTMNLFAQRSTHTSILGFDFPASWLQSVNALCIILLAPVFAWLWIRLGEREPSSPAKFVWALFNAGAGFAVLAVAAVFAASGQLVSPMWLIATYVFHTIGELCLSPVGLSAMTKLAPVRVAGLMMGVWFLSLSAGNYIGGRVASLYQSFSLPGLFTAVAVYSVIAAVILWLVVKPAKRLAGGVK